MQKDYNRRPLNREHLFRWASHRYQQNNFVQSKAKIKLEMFFHCSNVR